jgi:hypothetical protein
MRFIQRIRAEDAAQAGKRFHFFQEQICIPRSEEHFNFSRLWLRAALLS